jgi:hypothetical protein
MAACLRRPVVLNRSSSPVPPERLCRRHGSDYSALVTIAKPSRSRGQGYLTRRSFGSGIVPADRPRARRRSPPSRKRSRPLLRRSPRPRASPLPRLRPRTSSPSLGAAPARAASAPAARHPARREIERLLCQGASYKAIEAQLAPNGPSDASLAHHARRCIPHLLGERGEELRAEILTSVRGRAERLLERAEKLIDDAETGGECEACGAITQAAPPRDRAATINACNNVRIGRANVI